MTITYKLWICDNFIKKCILYLLDLTDLVDLLITKTRYPKCLVKRIIDRIVRHICTCYCWNSVKCFKQPGRNENGGCRWLYLFRGCGLRSGRQNSGFLSGGCSGGGRFFSCYLFSSGHDTLQGLLIDGQSHDVDCIIQWSSNHGQHCLIVKWCGFR